MIDALCQDLREALRRLRRAPGLASVVMLTLALGIGINTALFSVLNAIVLRPLPLEEPHRLVAVSAVTPEGRTHWLALVTAAELLQNQQSFESWCGYAGGGIFPTEFRGALSDSLMEFVTGRCYATLRVRPVVGRLISDADVPDTGAPAPVAVLGYGFWQRQFGGDPSAVGQTLNVDGVPLTIIGVTPPTFPGLRAVQPADVTVPATLLPRFFRTPERTTQVNYLIARLRDGVRLPQAQAELDARWPAIRDQGHPPGLNARDEQEFPTLALRTESVAGGFSYLRDLYSQPLNFLVGSSGLLLLLMCLQLSGLMLARDAAREHELAVRLALGATRRRLVQQRVIETLLLSACGATVALPLAWWASDAVGTMMWEAFPLPSLTPDLRVLGLTALVAIVVGLTVGLVPVLAATSRRGPLKLQQARTVPTQSRRWGKPLLVSQVALSLVMVFAANLFAMSLANLRAVDPGFRVDGMLLAPLRPQPGRVDEDEDVTAYYPELIRRVSALPGVESASLARLFPQFDDEVGFEWTTAPASAPDGSNEIGATMDTVSPGLFRTAGIPMVQGRDFSWLDAADRQPVAIINASLASRLFPTGDAVGQRIRLGPEPARQNLEIVGVVSDATIGSLRATHLPVVFRPSLQEVGWARYSSLVIRTRVGSAGLAASVSNAVASAGGHYVREITTAKEALDLSLARERTTAVVSLMYGGMAILLAAIGLYGLLAFTVARRTREIGVRMALGASARRVLTMVVSEGLAVTLVGVAIGIPCALAVGRLTAALLFGLVPSDVGALLGAAGCLVAVGAVAGFRPALRASRIDPMEALRCE